MDDIQQRWRPQPPSKVIVSVDTYAAIGVIPRRGELLVVIGGESLGSEGVVPFLNCGGGQRLLSPLQGQGLAQLVALVKSEAR